MTFSLARGLFRHENRGGIGEFHRVAIATGGKSHSIAFHRSVDHPLIRFESPVSCRYSACKNQARGMSMIFDNNLLAKILLSLASIGYGFLTIKADFNKTHATNPLWTPHARFHVVWQVLSYTGVSLIALWLIWMNGPGQSARLYLAAALAGAVYSAFFVAVFARRLCGGTLYYSNGYLPFQPPIGPKHWRWDANVTAFTILSLVLVAGAFAVR